MTQSLNSEQGSSYVTISSLFNFNFARVNVKTIESFLLIKYQRNLEIRK